MTQSVKSFILDVIKVFENFPEGKDLPFPSDVAIKILSAVTRQRYRTMQNSFDTWAQIWNTAVL